MFSFLNLCFRFLICVFVFLICVFVFFICVEPMKLLKQKWAFVRILEKKSLFLSRYESGLYSSHRLPLFDTPSRR